MLTPESVDDLHCDAVRALSFAACDDALSTREFVAIEAHLHRCVRCRNRYLSDAVFLRATRNAVALDSAPQSLRDRVAHILQPRAAENASA
ncbi:MAG: hypothetical protein H7099_09585 [Gemmatimonadaceae bacterium]|nr:hypothetical protein [Gemmatimonadaceae bacterium]